MEKCFEELALNVTAIPAVDGKKLTEEDLDEMGVTYMPGYKDPWSQRHMTFGEIGCFLSHYNVWKDVVDKGYKQVMGAIIKLN